MMNFTDTLHNPVYATFGVDAELTPAEGAPVSVTVIDKTAGIEVSDDASIDVGTIRPVAAVRARELSEKSIRPVDLDDGVIEFNGKAWFIKSHIVRPSPYGETDGQIYLILMEHSYT